jgi:hypothetical protein
VKDGKIESDYITKEESDYIINNIDEMFMYDGGVTDINGNRKEGNSYLREESRTIVIRKK